MKAIQFLGACGIVTGSSYLLTGEKGEQVLVDMGMFQEADTLSSRNYASLTFNAVQLSGVFLTHAHLDHCGRLPLLVKNGFKGKFYMTKATRQLATLSLLDAAKVAVEDNKHRSQVGSGEEGKREKERVLYGEEEIEKLVSQIEEVVYDQSFSVGEFQVIFRDAGHILGSASIEILDSSGKTIVFSGDLGNTPEDMIRPTEQIQKAAFVVMESTYGNRVHAQEDPSKVLQEEINAIEKDNGVLLIPAFSIERAQELLHRINKLKNSGAIGEKTLVFLDSPMAIRAMKIFQENFELYNTDMAEELKTDDPFDFPGFSLTVTSEESKAILFSPEPKVIISGSGMMSGGRILHHAINYLSKATTRLLIVGYQARGTLGDELLRGAPRVHIYHEEVSVNAHIREVEAMSCHADQPKLLAWLGNISGVEKVFITHGENDSRKGLEEKITSELGMRNNELGKKVEIVLPEMDEVVSLESA